MDLAQEITSVDIAQMRKELKKRKNRSSRNRFLITLTLATVFLLIVEFVFKEGLFRDFFLNVSAGTYAAAILYLYVERDYAENESQLAIAANLVGYTSRLIQVGIASKSKYKYMESMLKRVERLENAAKTGKYQNKLELEYLAWKLRMDALLEIDELLYLMSEREAIVRKEQEILVGLNLTSEVYRLDAVLPSNDHEQKLILAEKDKLVKELGAQASDFNNRFSSIKDELG